MPAASKPSAVSGWTAASGTITEPSNTDKDNGFSPAQKPPSSWFNFLFSRENDWQAYLRDAFPYANLGFIGESLLSTLAESLTARFDVPLAAAATSTRTLIFKLGFFAGKQVMVYATSAADIGPKVLEVAVNAYFDTDLTWKRTSNGIDSGLLRVGIGASEIRWCWRDDGAANGWADSFSGSAGAGTGWTTLLASDSGATTVSALVVDGTSQLTGAVSGLLGGTLTVANGLALTAGNATFPADVTVGDDITCDDIIVTDDIDAGGTATVGVLVTNGDATIGDDLTVAGETQLSGSLNVDGAVTADSGIYTYEHGSTFALFDGASGAAIGYWFGLTASSSQKLYRRRGGEVRYLTITASGAPLTDCIFEVQKVDAGASITTIATATLDAADLLKVAAFTAAYDATDYLRVRVSVSGGGTLVGPINFVALVEVKE